MASHYCRVYNTYALFNMPIKTLKITEDVSSLFNSHSNYSCTKSVNGNGRCNENVNDSTVTTTVDIDPDFLELENILCSFLENKNIHWSQRKIALGMLSNLIVPERVPIRRAVEIWIQMLHDSDSSIFSIAINALEAILKVIAN